MTIKGKGNIVREYAKEHGLTVVDAEIPNCFDKEDLYGTPTLRAELNRILDKAIAEKMNE